MTHESAEGANTAAARWMRLGERASLHSMLLDDTPEIARIDTDEQAEIMALLPSLEGRRALDLAAGVGRYTERFAELALQVTAVDLARGFIEENRRRNSRFGNIAFLCSDARDLDFEPDGFDLIFANWLLMYLDDDDLPRLLDKLRLWLSPDGVVFVRESCLAERQTESRRDHESYAEIGAATRYRPEEEYRRLFASRFAILRSGHIETYRRHYQTLNQRYWLLSANDLARDAGAR